MSDSIARYSSLQSMILTVLAIIVLVIFVGAIYSFIRAIFLFIFSHGDEAKKKQARNSIRFMVIGVMLTIGLLFFFPLVFERLKFDGYAVYTASNIFDRMGNLLNKMMDIGMNIKIGSEGTIYYEQPGRDDPISPSKYRL